ncbi:gas vesicle protein [Candidatus Parcubacteria bacterium]|nr:gas vesicle protein [Patescibacteria group bacterium]MCG2688345.1 gas vesicle protein [Candidatus Parcubacteria bacterium]
MEPKELTEKAKKQVADLTGFKEPAGIGIKKDKEGWVVTIEIVEKESIPRGMDVLGTYDVHLDAKGNLISYQRKELRKRTDTEISREE